MDKGTVIRTVLLGYALLNIVLQQFGYSALPFTEAEVETFISGALVVGASVWAWWKDNPVTKKAQAREEMLKSRGLK